MDESERMQQEINRLNDRLADMRTAYDDLSLNASGLALQVVRLQSERDVLLEQVTDLDWMRTQLESLIEIVDGGGVAQTLAVVIEERDVLLAVEEKQGDQIVDLMSELAAAQRWARLWKRAATVNRWAVDEYLARWTERRNLAMEDALVGIPGSQTNLSPALRRALGLPDDRPDAG